MANIIGNSGGGTKRKYAELAQTLGYDENVAGRTTTGSIAGSVGHDLVHTANYVSVNVPGPRSERVLAKIPDTDTAKSIAMEKHVVLSYTVDAQAAAGGFYIISRAGLQNVIGIGSINTGGGESTATSPESLADYAETPIPGYAAFATAIDEVKWAGMAVSIHQVGTITNTSGTVDAISQEKGVEFVPRDQYNTFTEFVRTPFDRDGIFACLKAPGTLTATRFNSSNWDDQGVAPISLQGVGMYFSGVQTGTVVNIEVSANLECYPNSNQLVNELTTPAAPFNLKALSAISDHHSVMPVIIKGITHALKKHHESKFMRFIHGAVHGLQRAFKWVEHHTGPIGSVLAGIGKVV